MMFTLIFYCKWARIHQTNFCWRTYIVHKHIITEARQFQPIEPKAIISTKSDIRVKANHLVEAFSTFHSQKRTEICNMQWTEEKCCNELNELVAIGQPMASMEDEFVNDMVLWKVVFLAAWRASDILLSWFCLFVCSNWEVERYVFPNLLYKLFIGLSLT